MYQQPQQEEEKEKEESDQLKESSSQQQFQQDDLNNLKQKKKISVKIQRLLICIECIEVLVVQLSQGYVIGIDLNEMYDDSSSYDPDQDTICSINNNYNLLRLILIALVLFFYIPIKILLARFMYVGIISEIIAIVLTVVSLIAFQNSVYISILIPTLRITFQLCNITSTVLNQEGNQHNKLLLRGFLSLQFFIFMNTIWQGCTIFNVIVQGFGEYQTNFSITLPYAAALLSTYILLFIARFYLRNKFDILDPIEDMIKINSNTNQQTDNFQTLSNKSEATIKTSVFNLFINPSSSLQKHITWKECLLSYFFSFIIIYLDANEPAFGQNFEKISVIQPGVFLVLLPIIQIMIALMTLEDTLNIIIVLLVMLNSINLFLFVKFEASDIIWQFQTIIAALASCIPLVVANYFDQETSIQQFQHQCYMSLGFFALSNFIQYLLFINYLSHPAAYSIVIVILNVMSIPVIYILNYAMRRINPSYQELQLF